MRVFTTVSSHSIEEENRSFQNLNVLSEVAGGIRTLAFHFLENNVRTYVVCGNEPGVYFYSLDANSRLAVLAARLGWSLPHFNSSIKSTFSDIDSH